MIVFANLEAAMKAGYHISDRTKAGYLVRTRTKHGWSMGIVRLKD